MTAALIYTAIASLDGYVNDAQGGFGWAEPSEEMHRFVNDQERLIGTYLYGRRLYEVMRAWQSDEVTAGRPAYIGEYAQIWRAAGKVVYSSTLGAVSTPRTRLERAFDPGQVRRIKESSDRAVSIGGSTLAASAFRAGLIDECHLFQMPVIVGGGTRAFPGGVRVPLRLVDQRRFQNGAVHLHYISAGPRS